MAFWWVNQNQTGKHEIAGGYDMDLSMSAARELGSVGYRIWPLA